MILQMADVSECLFAQLTFIRLFAGMRPPMSLQLALCRVRPAAYIASVRLLAGMKAFMDFHVGVRREAQEADGTLVWFFSGMPPGDVVAQVTFLRERLLANVAFEWLHAVVNALVGL